MNKLSLLIAILISLTNCNEEIPCLKQSPFLSRLYKKS